MLIRMHCLFHNRCRSGNEVDETRLTAYKTLNRISFSYIYVKHPKRKLSRTDQHRYQGPLSLAMRGSNTYTTTSRKSGIATAKPAKPVGKPC